MTLQERFATPEPTCCVVCRRRAGPVGYTETQRGPVYWVCDHIGCHRAARGMIAMPQEKLDAYEKMASREAIDTAGPYLDQIGQTDLAKLTSDQLDEFMARFLAGYETAMRRFISEHVAPF